MASQVETPYTEEIESPNIETSTFDAAKTTINSEPAENKDNKDVPEFKNIVRKLCYGDGNDSGVECVAGALQRALSSNSGGYASSGGLDEAAGNGSCASSMISCCSDTCEPKPTNINDCTSEVGSESSSVTGIPCERKQSVIKKKVALTEPNIVKSGKKDDNSVARSRSRAASANRAAVSGSQIISDRARSRDKMTSSTMSISKSVTPQNRSTPVKRSHIPDSLPSGLKEPSTPAIQRVVGSRTPSSSRNRTPVTPTIEDGRWPSTGTKATGTAKASRAGSATPENIVVKTRVGLLNLDLKSPTADKFATLPRRRREKSSDDLCSNARSSSVQRERMTSSVVRRQQSLRESPSTRTLSLPRRSKTIPRTKIYHETTVQTAITGKDIEDAFGGVKKDINVESIETRNKSSQVDIRDKEIELLQEQIRKLTEDYSNLQGQLNERSETLTSVEQQLNREREEKQAMTKELQSNTERVQGLLSLVKVEAPQEENGDSLLMLESQIQLSGYELELKQQEVDKLNRFCEELQSEMHKSVRVHQTLLEEKECAEKESNELQDFLHDEKAALVDALKEAEIEVERLKQSYAHKDVDIERLQEECRHLVRISEQRRQEYLGMQTKYNALEQRSKDLVIQQSSAVSGATLALAGLGSRLDSLVEQLIASYNISEQELEDVIYHNEAYTNSGNCSADGSPEFETATESKLLSDGSLSPQRHQSFIVAVINAIKSAAKHTVNRKEPPSIAPVSQADNESDSTEMLDSETEPCLMMENVLEDVTMPDSHSHNMVSSTGLMLSSQIDIKTDAGMDREEESIFNLSQAIANRQKIEQQTHLIMRHNSEHSTSDDISVHDSIAEMPSIAEYYSAQSLVDQVIDVDNLVTKLLKVLRIIQMDNDNCVQQLIGDKNKLQLNKEELLEKLRDWELVNAKLKTELEDASHQLIVNGSDLANSKLELQRHRNEIDRLNIDICNLSTLCSQHTTKSLQHDDILKALKGWQENRDIPESDLISHIVAACQEIPHLKEQLLNKERELNDLTNNQSRPMFVGNWKEAVIETKRQYEAIDRALETLNNIQSMVDECPALRELQRDLEETNFHSATTISVYTASLLAANSNNGHNHSSADCNANASNNGIQLTNCNGDAAGNTIDSTA
ncbi:uncharacterized protein PFB0145c-like isoform X2 [Bradysia coprophila]|uniref:uncharacterized protein PFB0145c-like isoform X2 n=1 Tax=Bradysia coprophila TaxID=38358 RepID=UPI00187D9D12|nr:uncharacterized protein PFB0145c-like isoform X2 [Bradysia coprophila]